MALSRPLADAGTVLRYTMGGSACAVAGPRPELVGRAVPVAVLDPAERGACTDVVLRVGALPSVQGRAPEVGLAPPRTAPPGPPDLDETRSWPSPSRQACASLAPPRASGGPSEHMLADTL